MQKRNIKRALVTDTFLIIIIIMVYFAAFVGVSLISDKPALKGSTLENKVGLQIAIDEQSGVDKYIKILEENEISATFFFDSSCARMQELTKQGFSTGFLHEKESVPVMSFGDAGEIISTSIDLDKLLLSSDWEATLEEKIAGGMLLFVSADNNFSDFEKIIQIVLNKGYTIVKMEEMFTKER